jgi:hypothetical protein
VHTVVNRLTFTDPVTPAIFAEFGTVADQMRDVDGFEAAHVVQTGEHEVVLLIVGRDAETLDRVATEVGSPWMLRAVVPHLAGPPERRLGPLLASTSYDVG